MHRIRELDFDFERLLIERKALELVILADRHAEPRLAGNPDKPHLISLCLKLVFPASQLTCGIVDLDARHPVGLPVLVEIAARVLHCFVSILRIYHPPRVHQELNAERLLLDIQIPQVKAFGCQIDNLWTPIRCEQGGCVG